MLTSDGVLSKQNTLILTVATGIYIIAPFMQSRAVKTIRAREFCASGQAVQGQFPVSDMPRLAGVVHRVHGRAEFRVAGQVDDHQRYLLSGDVSCEVSLTCQRCMQEVLVRLENDFLLVLQDREDQEIDLPERFDPLVLGDHDELELISVIEDELLLGLPISPMHDADSECAQRYRVDSVSSTRNQDSDDSVSSRRNTDLVKPFAGLAGLLNKLKSD